MTRFRRRLLHGERRPRHLVDRVRFRSTHIGHPVNASALRRFSLIPELPELNISRLRPPY